MNSSKNLIVALLALWCYTQNTNINLANNASILLILYALLTRTSSNASTLGMPMGMGTSITNTAMRATSSIPVF